MKSFSNALYQLRKVERLSQRKLAEISGVSFRQIQRVESGDCVPSLELARELLKVFNRELSIELREPQWSLLLGLGFPVSLSHKKRRKISSQKSWEELCYSLEYLYFKKNDSSLGRYRDGVKAILLTLKTHFPSFFKKLIDKVDPAWIDRLYLDKIEGRDIKLRNMALASIKLSGYKAVN